MSTGRVFQTAGLKYENERCIYKSDAKPWKLTEPSIQATWRNRFNPRRLKVPKNR